MLETYQYIPIINIDIWSQLEHFNKEEKWGDFSYIDVRLLWILDALRDDIARGFNILCAYELEGHAKKSFHKIGMAVDFYVSDTKPEELWDLYCYFLENWYGGTGVYPFWKPYPGIHLDIGPGYRTWTRDENGLYLYDSKEIKGTIMEYRKGAL